MKQAKRSCLSTFLALALLVGMSLPAVAAVDKETLNAAITDTAAYIHRTVPDPQVSSIGGEWAVLGLARSAYSVPDSYYQGYYETVEEYVRAHKGVLDDKKYTEYSRVIVALSAIGKDARSVAGYDLTKPLGDYETTILQGLNGPIWALIALDSAGYPMPENPAASVQATRQMYIDRILACQLPDGGWSLFGGTEAAGSGDGVSDPDITGMALQALAKYQDQSAVAQATEEALSCISAIQDDSGGFSSWGAANSESCAQIIVALTELGISLEDSRFVKSGNTLLDNLMNYYQKGAGFLHTEFGTGSNQMATEQAFYSLVAAQRALDGKNSLYRMGDATVIPDAVQEPQKEPGLEGKHPDVTYRPIVTPGITFPDLAGVGEAAAIEALASRGIINGRDNGNYDPAGSITRAEYAAILVRGLGLEPREGSRFTDVPADAWYAGYVGAAAEYGIINGLGDGRFNPGGAITRQETAVMTARAAALCGLDVEMDTASIRNMLAQFPDYMTTYEWTRQSLAVCYREGILDQSELYIRPLEATTRAEMAQMFFQLLSGAALL